MFDIPDNILIKLGKLLLFTVLIAGLGYFFLNGFNIVLRTIVPWFMPFIFALVISLLIEPLVELLERKLNVSRTVAAIIGLISFFGLIGTLMISLIFLVIVEMIELSTNVPEYLKMVRLVLEDAVAQAQYIQYLYLVDLPPELTNITYSLENIVIKLKDISDFIINYILYLISSLPGILTLVIIAAVSTFFLSRDKKELGKTVLTLVPEQYRQRLSLISSRLVRALIGFIRAQFILISITGLQTVIGLYIIGVEYALSVGILVGIVDILPIIGPGIIFIPWLIAILMLGNTSFALALLFLYGMIIIVRSILEPKIVADNIGLHPLTTLIGIYVGLKSIGVIGIILGPIIIIIIKAFRQTKLN